VCLEYQIRLANELNADLYLDIYDFYDDANVKQVARRWRPSFGRT
jgi:hypothetical protein